MNKSSASCELLLASASPRRSELLKQLGWAPVVMPVGIDERVNSGEKPGDYCQRMALEKSLAAQQLIQANKAPLNLPVLTADTVVVIGGEILGKPEDQEAAKKTLLKLSCQTHQVLTSVGVYYNGQTEIRLSSNAVKMSELSPDHIDAYIASGEPMDKAGSYGIQGMAAMWVESITGSYSSIMGLPLYETSLLLRELGIMAPIDMINNL